jgi:hypothetical protein
VALSGELQQHSDELVRDRRRLRGVVRPLPLEGEGLLQLLTAAFLAISSSALSCVGFGTGSPKMIRTTPTQPVPALNARR